MSNEEDQEADKSPVPAGARLRSSSSDSEDSLFDVDSIIKCNQMEPAVVVKNEPEIPANDGGGETSEDVFQIAAKAEKLLQEILQASTKPSATTPQLVTVKSEPVQQPTPVMLPSVQQAPPPPPPPVQPMMFPPAMLAGPYYNPAAAALTPGAFHNHQMPGDFAGQFAFPPPGPGPGDVRLDPAFFVTHPPPANIASAAAAVAATGAPMIINSLSQPPFYYSSAVQQQQQAAALASPSYFHPTSPFSPFNQPPPPHLAGLPPHLQLQQTQFPFGAYPATLCLPPGAGPVLNQFVNGQRKRKFGENANYNNNGTYARFKTPPYQNNGAATNGYQTKRFSGGRFDGKESESPDGGASSSAALGGSLVSHAGGGGLNDEEDLNLMRERELKDLKCKSVVEKMGVFLKYYQQFKEAYIQRVQTLECSDSLKVQFNSLIKYLSDYESCLAELDMMITEHERVQCKNNHRKTKRLFNKTKAFIRYECNKRLQSYIFEYRRLINSQDRYAGMYDLLDMNNYLITLLPDIGVSMRRYINRCEKARQEAEEEQLDEEEYGWNSDNSAAESGAEDEPGSQPTDASDIKIPSFKDFVEEEYANDASLEKENAKKRADGDEEADGAEDGAERSSGHEGKKATRGYESFSKGVDALNKYLLKRVEEEETLDELVKERIIKWINKRQSKYILIFSEVDRLLNQHKAGECYQKFHSYLLFNLGKLVTVCDSYHQKLKELLYSTTIRRKKKRKRVKLLPEAMADVFNEIIDLKRGLESAKLQIKRCNELKPAKQPNPTAGQQDE